MLAGPSIYESGDERAEEGFASAPGVVHALEEADAGTNRRGHAEALMGQRAHGQEDEACAGPDRLQAVSAHNGLAGLSPFKYREEREDTAERLGLYPDKMDAAVAERRTARWKANGHAKPEREEPWAPAIRVVTARELLAMEVPVREHALAPVLPLPGLAMLVAPRGMGKPYAALARPCGQASARRSALARQAEPPQVFAAPLPAFGTTRMCSGKRRSSIQRSMSRVIVPTVPKLLPSKGWSGMNSAHTRAPGRHPMRAPR